MNKWYSIKGMGKKSADIDIFDEIGAWGITAKQFVKDLKAMGDVDTIKVTINSPGGSVADGNAIYNALLKHKATVNVEVTGVALSMGSVIAMAGDHISMAENAVMMVHDPITFAYGNADVMRETADILDKFKVGLVAAYARKTGMNEAEITELMNDETWMTAEEAVAYGFADEVTESVQVAAMFDLTAFRNVPESIVKPGEPEQPSEVGTMATQADKDKGTAPVAVNIDDAIAKAKTEAIQGEQKRRSDIKGVFAIHGERYNEVMNKCLDDPAVTVDKSRELLLEAIGKGGQPLGGEPRIEVIADERDKFKAGALLAIAARAGLAKDDENNNFRGYSMMDIARHSLEIVGMSTRGMTKLQIVGAAFTHSTSDFPYLLADSANKAMLRGYSEAPETFGMWTRAGNLSDFKTASRVGMSEFNDLDEIKQNGEYKYGTFGEFREQITLATYGKMFNIGRQAIINDDLDAFTMVPRKMGRAAARKVGDLAWGVLTTNANMADGVALFHANHSNLAGSGAAPSVTTVGAARAAMAKQTDSSGNAYLNIRPSYLLVPIDLEDTSQVLVSSEFDPSITTRTGKPNPIRGYNLTVASDARLSANSTTAWYLAADPNMFDTVEVAYLDGNPNPFLEQQNGWNVDGVEFKVRIDAAAKALEHRTMYKDPGV